MRYEAGLNREKHGPLEKRPDYPQKLGLSKFYKITKLYNLNLEGFENTAVIARVISHRNTRKGVMVVCTLDARYSPGVFFYSYNYSASVP